MSSPYKTFTCLTFGCKVNFADTSFISKQLIDLGFAKSHSAYTADIFIINTCSVTEMADKKAQKMIKKIHLNSPDSKIIVTGCYAQLKPKEIIKIPGVDYVIGMKDKLNVSNYTLKDEVLNSVNVSNIKNVNNFKISYSTHERTRAFIKVQDGCSYSCSYCTIPNARGKSRSDTIGNTINKIKTIINAGVKEIVLSGINLGDFGQDNNENLLCLLKQIEKIENLKRYRISSIEPNLINKDLVSFLSSSKKWARHLHIPLQSGSDKILKDMKRRYSASYYKSLIESLKEKLPSICIGVDVIVGFPSENHDDFMKTFDLLKALDVSYLHVFKYSKRDNTEAALFKTVISKEEINKRRNKLQKLSKSLHAKYLNKYIGKTKSVLFENSKDGLMNGLTDNYIRVYVVKNPRYIGKIKKVKIINNVDFVIGEIID